MNIRASLSMEQGMHLMGNYVRNLGSDQKHQAVKRGAAAAAVRSSKAVDLLINIFVSVVALKGRVCGPEFLTIKGDQMGDE